MGKNSINDKLPYLQDRMNEDKLIDELDAYLSNVAATNQPDSASSLNLDSPAPVQASPSQSSPRGHSALRSPPYGPSSNVKGSPLSVSPLEAAAKDGGNFSPSSSSMGGKLGNLLEEKTRRAGQLATDSHTSSPFLYQDPSSSKIGKFHAPPPLLF